MKQLLQIRCWNCYDVFTMSAELNTDPPGANRVNVLVPCPYCAKPNRVTVSQEQVRTVTVHRGWIARKIGYAEALQNFDKLAKQLGGSGLEYWEMLARQLPPREDGR